MKTDKTKPKMVVTLAGDSFDVRLGNFGVRCVAQEGGYYCTPFVNCRDGFDNADVAAWPHARHLKTRGGAMRFATRSCENYGSE